MRWILLSSMIAVVMVSAGCPKGAPDPPKGPPPKWHVEWEQALAVKPSGDWYDLSMTDDRYGGDGRIEWFCAITDGGEPVMFKVISNGKVLSSFEKRDGQPAVILMHRDPHDYRYIFRGPMRSSIDKMVEKVPSREGRK